MINYIRWALTAILLVFVWRGDWWAVPVCLTLQAIAIEGLSYLLRRNALILSDKVNIEMVNLDKKLIL